MQYKLGLLQKPDCVRIKQIKTIMVAIARLSNFCILMRNFERVAKLLKAIMNWSMLKHIMH